MRSMKIEHATFHCLWCDNEAECYERPEAGEMRDMLILCDACGRNVIIEPDRSAALQYWRRKQNTTT